MLGVSSAAASNAESDPGKEGMPMLGVSSAAASDPESDPGKEGMSGVADGISVGSSSLQPVGSVQSSPSPSFPPDLLLQGLLLRGSLMVEHF